MDIESLRKMTSGPRDSAMLRLTLAQLLLDQMELCEAESHLLAALEMAKQQLIRIEQASPFAPIWLFSSEADGEGDAEDEAA